MTEHIHFKISPQDKKELLSKAKKYGLGLSSYIRFKLLEDEPIKEIWLREMKN